MAPAAAVFFCVVIGSLSAVLSLRGCGLINLLLPVFVAAGAVVDWLVGRSFGIFPGSLGSVVGLVLGVPSLGIVSLAAVWVAELVERVRGCPS